MKVRALVEIKSTKGIIPVGEIIDIPLEMVEKLSGKVEPVTSDAGRMPEGDPLANDLFRWYVLEAARIYRSAPMAGGSWDICKGHEKAAEALCIAGNIPAARAELEKALAAMRCLPAKQQSLL
jgi:hypothetical protein